MTGLCPSWVKTDPDGPDRALPVYADERTSSPDISGLFQSRLGVKKVDHDAVGLGAGPSEPSSLLPQALVGSLQQLLHGAVIDRSLDARREPGPQRPAFGLLGESDIHRSRHEFLG
jgi:hypothetical protein